MALGGFAGGGTVSGHIAIDGKTLKGSRRLDAKALHVLSAFATALSAVIGDIAVEPGQNEITAALAFLKDLPLEGGGDHKRTFIVSGKCSLRRTRRAWP